MQEDKVEISYTIINHTARLKMGLTAEEYCVMDLIYHVINDIDKGEWCKFSKAWMGKQLGFTKQWINRIVNKLIEKKLLESRDGVVNKSNGKQLKITIGWYELVYMNKRRGKKGGNDSFQKGGNDLTKGGNDLTKGGNETHKNPGTTMNTMNNNDISTTNKTQNDRIGEQGEDPVPAKFKNTIGYLSAIPEEDILHWIEKFPVLSREIIIREAGKAKGWMEANGKRKKDYQAFMRNWLDNTAERLEKQKGGGYASKVYVAE